jgi:hypothetical protein
MVDKEEYDIQLKKYDEIEIQYQNLQQRFDELQIEYDKLLKTENIDANKFFESNKTFRVVQESKNNLLFDYFDNGEYIFGLTEIEGYYTKITTRGWDGFIITNGEKIYLDSIKKLIDKGNSVYKNNENGNVIATIKIDQLNNDIKNRIIGSNKNSIIKLKIFLKQPHPSSGRFPPFIEILDVI